MGLDYEKELKIGGESGGRRVYEQERNNRQSTKWV